MTKKFRLETKALAEQIYVKLMTRNVAFEGGAPKATANPEGVAKLSFVLAEVFLGVQDDLNAENMPKDPTFKLSADDIASWMK
jgi:hypothetical protein